MTWNPLSPKIWPFFLIAGLIFPNLSRAQNPSVQGQVKSLAGTPLVGVTIMVKGTNRGALSREEGRFEFSGVDLQRVSLIFRYLGYETTTIALDGRSQLKVVLSPQNLSLDEVVLIGYGTQRKKDVTGAISSIETEALEAVPVPNIGEAIQGRAAGVQVITNGQPGSNPTIRIRGLGTIGNNDPLVVVDGMPLNGGLNQVNLNDVASIQVLKDASATAIYGARGANGVVIIQTKRGSGSETSLSFDMYEGIAQATDQVEVLNAAQFADFHNDLLAAGGIPLNPEFRNPADLGEGTDWLGEFFRPATLRNYTLSYSGGNERSRIYTSFNYFDQKGIVQGTDYQRFILQFNTDTWATDFLKFGNTLKLNHDIKRSGDFSLQRAMLALPTQAVYDSTGDFTGPVGQPIYSGDVENPLGKALTVENTTRGYNAQGSVFGELTFLDHFTFKTLLGLEANFWKTRTWAPPYQWGSDIQENAFLGEGANQAITLLWDNTLTYERRWDNGLHLSGVVGTSAQENRFEYLSGSIQNFPSTQTQTLDNGVDQITLNGSASEWAIFSLFTRVNADFAGKYYLTATLRRDGSSRFGEGNRYGNFPSGSVSWRISEENFFSSRWIEDLKLRLGAGITGNQEIGNYSFASSYNTYLYNFGGNFAIAAVPTVLPNANVQWESQEQYNLGLDLALWKNRVNLTVDAYLKNTKDMLVPQPVPVTSGYSDIFVPFVNAGQVQNRGIEILLSTVNVEKADWRWTSDFVFSYNQNEVIDLNSDVPLVTGNIGLNFALSRIQNGYPINVFYGYQTDGLFQNPEEVAAHAQQVPGSSPSNGTSAGDLRFRDLNHDGLITDADRTFLGSPLPDYTFSLNNTLSWRKLSLTVFLQGVYGNEIFNANRIFTEGMAVTTNQTTAVLDRWTGPGTSQEMPRAVFGDPNNNSRASDRFIEDGSYLRVKTATLSYQLPPVWFGQKIFEKASVYVSGQNLYTLTRYSGFDPEASVGGIDNNLYPVTRTVSAGLNLDF